MAGANGVKTMRWRIVVAGLMLALAQAAGCKQQCFMTDCDYHHYQELGLPSGLECDPSAGSQAGSRSLIPPPATILHPERDIRYISLAEAIAIALEQGTVGNGFQNVVRPGQPGSSPNVDDTLPTFRGQLGERSDSIRVLSLDPAITGSNIEVALSKFDAHFTSSMTWTTTEQPIGNAQTGVQALGRPSLQSINTQANVFDVAFVKPLPTGGVAGITFMDDYSLTNSPLARVNPSYTPTLQFQFEQPLLQGFGVEINQLRAAHPGGILPGDQFNTGGRVEGILITRLRYDQARAEFERNVQAMVVNVETAYWSLYGAYWDLYSREQALRQAFEAWKISNAKFEAGNANISDFSQTRGQYELFRGDRIESLERVMEVERNLRGLLGMPMEDGKRLVPCDTPTLAPFHPDWDTAQNEAMTLKPELVLVREELKARQLELINQKNLQLPDLRFTSTYGITAIGQQLDGPGTQNALRNLASNHFNNWSLGLRLDVPLGFREANANVRIARLNLARTFLVLRDTEYREQRFLTEAYRNLFGRYAVIEARRAQREAFARQLGAQFAAYEAGRGTLDILLEAQRFWAQALSSEYQAIVDYNNALAIFEFAKGTILHHDNVYIADGPLPQCAQVRAVAHEQERSKALVLLERAVPVEHAPAPGTHNALVLPQLPVATAPSLPALFKGSPSLPGEGMEGLPMPKQATSDAPAMDKGPSWMPQGPATPATSSATPVIPTAVVAPSPEAANGTPEAAPANETQPAALTPGTSPDGR